MTIKELIKKFDMGSIGPKERRMRVAIAIHQLEDGREIRGVIDGKVTMIRLTNEGYRVTQIWIIPRDEEVSDG